MQDHDISPRSPGEPIRSRDVVGDEDVERSPRLAVLQARDKFGWLSAEHASARGALGSVLLAEGKVDEAIEAFQVACAIELPASESASQDRLTYLLGLGVALQEIGDLNQAEAVFLRSLEGRSALFGSHHWNYALGLESLAEVLMLLGKTSEAFQRIEHAIAIYHKNSHPRLAPSLALRAEIAKSAGHPAFAEDLSGELAEQVGETVLIRMDGVVPSLLMRQVLFDLLQLMVRRLGEGHQLTLDVLAEIANSERVLGDTRMREECLRRLLAAHDAQRQEEAALQSCLGLALALSEADKPQAAEETYLDALTRADRLQSPAARAQVLRNIGLFLGDQGRYVEAEAHLRAAVAEAESSADQEMLSRTEVALGIFLQHGGRFNVARHFLTQALGRLPPDHMDALCGRAHLNALQAGKICECEEIGSAFGAEEAQIVPE